VDLLLALPRPKVLGRLYARLACLGVDRVLLCNAAKVERYYFDSHVLAPELIRERLLLGLAQAGDTRMPELSVHRSFRKLVEDELPRIAAGSRRWLFDLVPDGAELELGGALEAIAPDERVLVAVGPEGGWVDFERSRFDRAGFRRIRLGRRVLFVDLAVSLAVGAVHAFGRGPQ
jgi:RsmE family RNA methyltransferase